MAQAVGLSRSLAAFSDRVLLCLMVHSGENFVIVYYVCLGRGESKLVRLLIDCL